MESRCVCCYRRHMTHQIHHVPRVNLTVADTRLPFETIHAAEIDAHWAKAVAEKPHMFDGRVHFSTGYRVEGDTITATCVPGRFAALMYWRDMGFPDKSFRHVFGCVVPRASDGAYLIGRMSAHTANAGRVYFPGGAIDENDVKGDRIDIDNNIMREMEEELGLTPGGFPFLPGYRICITDVAVAIGRVLDLPWPAEEARKRVLDRARTHGDGEIADLIIVRHPMDLDGLDVVPYARPFVTALLEQP